MRNREKYVAYKRERRRLRRDLAVARYDEHAAEIREHLTDEQAAKLATIDKAFDVRDRKLGELRAGLAADIEAAVGRQALEGVAERLRDAYGTQASVPDFAETDDDLWASAYASRDAFGVARTYLELSDTQEEELAALLAERTAAYGRAIRDITDPIGARYVERVAKSLLGTSGATFTKAWSIVQAYLAKRDEASRPYTRAAIDAGLRSTHMPGDAVHIVYRISAALPEKQRRRVTEAMQKTAHSRHKEVQREMKTRGVERKSPEYKDVYAEVSASVSERVQERQLAQAHKLLPTEHAKALGTLLSAWRQCDADRKQLAMATGAELVGLVGREALIGR
jgi:hypothetical protein